MAFYLCPWNSSEHVELLPEFKETKHSYCYTGDFKWIFGPSYFRYNQPRKQYQIRKNRLCEIGFIIEANDTLDAITKRYNKIIEKFKEDLDLFESEIKLLLEMHKDTIYGMYKSTTTTLNFLVNENFGEVRKNFYTNIKYSNNSSREESEDCYKLWMERRNKIVLEIVNSFNLNTEIDYNGCIFPINIDHPGLDVSLTTFEHLRIKPKNSTDYSEMILQINAFNSWGSSITLDELGIARYNKLRDAYMETLKTDFFCIANGYIYKYQNDEWICNSIRNYNLIEYKHIQKRKWDIKIDCGVIEMFATADFIMERLVLKKINDNGYQFWFRDLKFGTQKNCGITVAAEIKRQLGRDLWNAFLLINEVSES